MPQVALEADPQHHSELISGMEVGLALFIGRLMAIIYAITFPTIIDRSLSGYVLEKLVQRGGAIRFDTWDAVI